MNKKTYAILAIAFLLMFLLARVADLDLGGFGIGLLIIAAGLGIAAIVGSNAEISDDS